MKKTIISFKNIKMTCLLEATFLYRFCISIDYTKSSCTAIIPKEMSLLFQLNCVTEISYSYLTDQQNYYTTKIILRHQK